MSHGPSPRSRAGQHLPKRPRLDLRQLMHLLEWVVLPGLAAAAVGAAVGYRMALLVGLVSGAIAFFLALGNRNASGLLLMGAGVSLALSGTMAARGPASVADGSAVSSGAGVSFSEQIERTVMLDASVRHRANWILTVLSVSVLRDSNLRFDLEFGNASAVLGSPLQATNGNTYLEDDAGTRYSLVPHSGSWLEEPIYRENVVPGGTIDTYLVLEPPADLTRPFTFHFGDYPPIAGIRLDHPTPTPDPNLP
jgi:hypothetical protein